MASTSYANTVMVRAAFSPECNMFALTCKELPGLFLAGKDLSALQKDVPNVIKQLYKLDCGMDVIVTEVRTAEAPAEQPIPTGFIQVQKKFVAIPQSARA